MRQLRSVFEIREDLLVRSRRRRRGGTGACCADSSTGSKPSTYWQSSRSTGLYPRSLVERDHRSLFEQTKFPVLPGVRSRAQAASGWSV